MKTEQLNLFGISRIDFSQQVELTIQSLTLHGAKHKHWAIAWSMGKDSTTVLTLIVQLIITKQIPAPESLTVLCADTRMELIPLWFAAKEITKKLETLGIKVKIVTAPIDERFFVYILGRGVPPPSNTFRWCTGQIKVKPMEFALKELHESIGEKILMITGVRQGESAIRDGRISLSCSKNGSECGQGWYQTGLDNDMCSTLAPILHWRVCTIWDWLKIFAPSKQYGEWPTAILADAYGGDEAEEVNARTGCIGCPLASKDKSLSVIIKINEWAYLSPLLKLRELYVEMRKPNYRLRKNGEFKKDGSLSKNQQRLGPLTIEARKYFLQEVLQVQKTINKTAIETARPTVDFINQEEESRINELIDENTWPNGWNGKEITGDQIVDVLYNNGSIMETLFK